MKENELTRYHGGAAPLHILLTGYLANKIPSTRRAYINSLGYLFEFLGMKSSGESFEEFVQNLTRNPEIGEAIQGFTPVFAVAFKQHLFRRVGRKGQAKRKNLKQSPDLANAVGLAPKTLHRHWAACRGFFKWLALNGYPLAHIDPLHPNLTPLPKASPGTSSRALTEEEVLSLLGMCDLRTKQGKQDACMIALFFGGGLRMSEAIGLKLEDIRVTRNGTPYLFLAHTKKGVEDRQALPHWASTLVVGWWKVREKEGALPHHHLLAPLRCSSHRGAKPLNHTTINKRLKMLAAHAGLKGDISSHTGRSTAITQLLDQGFGHREVKDFSRHSSISMVELYDKAGRDIEKNVGLMLEYRRKN